MTPQQLHTIELETSTPVTHSVIWLHGLGASGDDFVPIVPELGLPAELGVRFIFPNAPERPITINNGMAMPAWYDITSLDFAQREQDVAGTQSSASAIDSLIEQEIERGVPTNKIILAGYSQGGAIALYAGLTSRHRVAGILALSTYLPLADQVFDDMNNRDEADDDRTTLPIFFAHGIHDEVILLKYAEQSCEVLQQAKFQVEWSTWPMSHQVIAEEIKAIGGWLTQQLGK